MHDYDRRVLAYIPPLGQQLHKPAVADRALGEAYLAVVSFKQSIDEMEEIPPNIRGVYDQAMHAMSAIATARQSTNQLREMTRRLPR